MDVLRIEIFASMVIIDGGEDAALPSGSGGPVLAGPEAIFVAGRVEADAPTVVRIGPPVPEQDLVLAYTGKLATPDRVVRIVDVGQRLLAQVAVLAESTRVAIHVTDLEEPDEIHVVLG